MLDLLSSDNFMISLYISFAFIVIFVVAELMRYKYKIEVEKTRKFVHFTSGAICLSFPYLLTSHISVLILCVTFIGIMYLSKKYNFLQSIHEVKRNSEGGVYFPIAVYLTFLIAIIYGYPSYYVLAILILAISDSTAALIGKRYGKHIYLVEDDNKSLEGSVAFFITSFLILFIGLSFLSELSIINILLLSIYISIVVTAIEAISLSGTDNLFIPLSVQIILLKSAELSRNDLIQYLLALIIIGVGLYYIGKKSKNLSISALIGISLSGFGAYALMDFSWLMIVLVGLLFHTFIIKEQPSTDSDPINYRIRAVFLFLSVSILWLFIANYNPENYLIYYISFLVNIISRLSIQWKRKYFVVNSKENFAIKIGIIGRLLILCIVIIYPSYLLGHQLFQVNEFINIVLICFTLSLIIEVIYWLIVKKYNDLNTLQYARVISLLSMSVTGVYVLANLF